MRSGRNPHAYPHIFPLRAQSMSAHPTDRRQRSRRSRTPWVRCRSDGPDGRSTARHQFGVLSAISEERAPPGGQPGAEGELIDRLSPGRCGSGGAWRRHVAAVGPKRHLSGALRTRARTDTSRADHAAGKPECCSPPTSRGRNADVARSRFAPVRTRPVSDELRNLKKNKVLRCAWWRLFNVAPA